VRKVSSQAAGGSRLRRERRPRRSLTTRPARERHLRAPPAAPHRTARVPALSGSLPLPAGAAPRPPAGITAPGQQGPSRELPRTPTRSGPSAASPPGLRARAGPLPRPTSNHPATTPRTARRPPPPAGICRPPSRRQGVLRRTETFSGRENF